MNKCAVYGLQSCSDLFLNFDDLIVIQYIHIAKEAGSNGGGHKTSGAERFH